MFYLEFGGATLFGRVIEKILKTTTIFLKFVYFLESDLFSECLLLNFEVHMKEECFFTV